VGGQDFLGLLALGGGPGEFPAAVAGGLIQLAAQPVPLGPQLGRGQPLQVVAIGGVDGQRLAAGPGQDLSELQVAIGLLAIRQVQVAGAVGFWSDYGV
jgi:hypothetical protein